MRSASRPSSSLSSSSRKQIIIINNKEQDLSFEKLNEIISKLKKNGPVDVFNLNQNGDKSPLS